MKTLKFSIVVFCLIFTVFSNSGFKSSPSHKVDNESNSVVSSNPAELTALITAEQGSLTVNTVKVFEIKSNRASCSLTVTGSPVTEKGVCFSLSPDPTISSKKSMAPGNPTNNGTAIMGGLTPGKTYYVKAYAKSGNNVFYGNELSFTTTTDDQKSTTNTRQKVEPKTGGTK